MVAPHVNLYKRQNGNNRKPGRNGDRWLNSSKTGKTTLSYTGFSKANPSHDQFNTKGKKNGTKEREDGKPRLKDSQGSSPSDPYLILATSLPPF